MLLLAIAMTATSCEEVIDVDLNTAAPRLVIDASLKWKKGTDGSNQEIILSTTTGYFDQNIPKVSGATIFVTNSDGVVFDFLENSEIPGSYICSDFLPTINESYTLTVIHDDMTYTATETLKPVPLIDKIEQKDDGGFIGENIEIKFFYTDDAATDDYYLFRTKLSRYSIPQYSVSGDEFYQGNQIFGIYSNEDIASGDKLDITLSGISESYFNYMQVLLSIGGSAGGSPFQSPPATVRGNIINTTQIENYALGYFTISETDRVVYNVE